MATNYLRCCKPRFCNHINCQAYFTDVGILDLKICYDGIRIYLTRTTVFLNGRSFRSPKNCVRKYEFADFYVYLG